MAKLKAHQDIYIYIKGNSSIPLFEIHKQIEKKKQKTNPG